MSSLYDLRYSAGYKKKVVIAYRTLRKIDSLCACCMRRKVKELHHTEYGVKEILGENYFGVCLQCHNRICHSKQNWIVDRTFPELFNHNTPEFVQRLKSNYKKLQKRKR